MTAYRIVVTIPSEIYVDCDSLDKAKEFIDWVAQNYDEVEYPMSSKGDARDGLAEVKVISIEKARPSDRMTPYNATNMAMHQPVNTAEGSKEPAHKPKGT